MGPHPYLSSRQLAMSALISLCFIWDLTHVLLPDHWPCQPLSVSVSYGTSPMSFFQIAGHVSPYQSLFHMGPYPYPDPSLLGLSVSLSCMESHPLLFSSLLDLAVSVLYEIPLMPFFQSAGLHNFATLHKA